jgi:hypothetical protein
MKIYIATDSTITLQVSKVVKLLNSKCSFIEFEELKLSYQAPDKLVSHPTTHKKYLRHIKTNLKCNDFIILATEVQYDDNYFYWYEEGLYILSFFAWEYLTNLPKENGLVYLINGLLADELVPSDSKQHKKRLGCINDYLLDKTRVHDGMRAGRFCNVCKKYIQQHGLTKAESFIYRDVISMLKHLSAASKKGRNVVGFKNSAPAAPATPETDFTHRKNSHVKSIKHRNGASMFISYSHKDEKHRMKLESHLEKLQKSGMVAVWTDREIMPGQEWAKQIDKNLNSAGIILMLISNNFISSDYCYDIEMKTALAKHRKGTAIVIPVILRKCRWRVEEFAKLEALPAKGIPIEQFTPKNEAYTSIARAIYKLVSAEQ